jgi:hypothetical protein
MVMRYEWDSALALLSAVLSRVDESSNVTLYLSVLRMLAMSNLGSGHMKNAWEFAIEAARLAPRAANQTQLVDALWIKRVVADRRGDVEAQRAIIVDLTEIISSCTADEAVAFARYVRGTAASSDDPQQTREDFELALRYFDSQGSLFSEAIRFDLAWITAELGDYEHARSLMLEDIDRNGPGFSDPDWMDRLANLAFIEALRGDGPTAAGYWLRSLGHQERFHDPDAEINCLVVGALVLMACGLDECGATVFGTARQMANELGSTYGRLGERVATDELDRLRAAWGPTTVESLLAEGASRSFQVLRHWRETRCLRPTRASAAPRPSA